MEQIITYSLKENIVEKVSELLLKEKDLSRCAVVFGGKRPGLFLKKLLAGALKKSFIPPRIFSMDQFMEYIVSPQAPIKKISSLDAAYIVFTAAKKIASVFVAERGTFSSFLPWALEIISFIEQLDLEMISDNSLVGVEKSAEIGYDIPESINTVLKHIITLRTDYHSALHEKKYFSRGLVYESAARMIDTYRCSEFDRIYFCGLYYLHATELAVFKNLIQQKKAIGIFQGNPKEWPVLEKIISTMGSDPPVNLGSDPFGPSADPMAEKHIKLYEAFDMHSQICMAREIIKNIPDQAKTVIVLPRSESVIPLLSEIAHYLGNCNVSMGYPFKRSPIFVLCKLLAHLIESKKEQKFYAHAYLKVLMHPLVKNTVVVQDSTVTRIIVHTIEEILKGNEKSSIGGSLFIPLSDIENEKNIYRIVQEKLAATHIILTIDEISSVLKRLHELFFTGWDNIQTVSAFVEKMMSVLDSITHSSAAHTYPLTFKGIEAVYRLLDEFKWVTFNTELFAPAELWHIFMRIIEGEKISFIGTPLKGTQILGLWETRSLTFETVILVDVNESILPQLTMYEPLIPREVMINLGLNRLEKEEEIQRYHVMRLLVSAQNVHCIYEKTQEKERSRFLEELLWHNEKKTKKRSTQAIQQVRFMGKTHTHQKNIPKTNDIIRYLKQITYSPTKLDVYLSCPARFYYHYVLGLEEKEDLLDAVEARQIGVFIHELLHKMFQPFLNRKPVIDHLFKGLFFQELEKKFKQEIEPRMRADSILLKGIVFNRLERFLEKEAERPISKIIGLEKKNTDILQIHNVPVAFHYVIDRLEELDDASVLVIDYKTGSIDATPSSFDSIQKMSLSRESIRNTIKSFQLPLYYYFVANAFPEKIINAELYSLKTLKRTSFIREKDRQHTADILQACMKSLEYIFDELWNSAIPFIAELDERTCAHCPFSLLCG